MCHVCVSVWQCSRSRFRLRLSQAHLELLRCGRYLDFTGTVNVANERGHDPGGGDDGAEVGRLIVERPDVELVLVLLLDRKDLGRAQEAGDGGVGGWGDGGGGVVWGRRECVSGWCRWGP